MSALKKHTQLENKCSPHGEKRLGNPKPPGIHDIVKRCVITAGIFVLVLDTHAGIFSQDGAKKVHDTSSYNHDVEAVRKRGTSNEAKVSPRGCFFIIYFLKKIYE